MKEKDRVIRRLKNQIEELEKASACLTPDDLLDILDIGADSSAYDLRRADRVGSSLDLSAMHFAKGIVESQRFKGWQSEDMSATLFVEGGLSLAAYGRNTPMTLLSSTVVKSLDDEGPSVAIHFFCGLHTSSTDSLKGPSGMIRSLIGQILQLFAVDLNFASTRRYRQQLEILNLRTLCDCLIKLVRRLPVDTVLFCVIDGISFFEKREWAEDCRKAINELQDLAYDEEVRAVFKLLITSPARSKFIGAILPPECCMFVQGDEMDGRGGPTARQVSMRNRRSVNTRERRGPWRAEVSEAEILDFVSDSDLSG